MKKKHMQQKIQ